jgi:hypothetical protein
LLIDVGKDACGKKTNYTGLYSHWQLSKLLNSKQQA